jgi:hypothetical protein
VAASLGRDAGGPTFSPLQVVRSRPGLGGRKRGVASCRVFDLGLLPARFTCDVQIWRI